MFFPEFINTFDFLSPLSFNRNCISKMRNEKKQERDCSSFETISCDIPVDLFGRQYKILIKNFDKESAEYKAGYKYFSEIILPGIKPEDVQVTANDEENSIHIVASSSSSSYNKQILFPEKVDTKTVSAKLALGILTLKFKGLEKEEKKTERKIAVE